MKLHHSIVGKIVSASLVAVMAIAPTMTTASISTVNAASIESSTILSKTYQTGVYVATTGTKVRSGPGAAYEQLSTLVKGTQVTITEVDNGWGYFFEREDSYGWVSMKYLKLVRSESEHALGTYKCKASTLKVRAGAGTSYESVGTLKKDQQVILRLLNGDWGYIRDESIKGWISIDYLEYVSDAMERFECGTYMVATSELNMRTGNSTAFDAVMAVHQYETVAISKVIGDWGYTVKDGKAGWLNLNYLTLLSTEYTQEKVQKKTEIEIGSNVMIKSGSKTYANTALSSWMFDTEFQVLSITGTKVTIGLNGKRSTDVHIDDLVLMDSLYCCGDGAVMSYGLDVSRWQGDVLDWEMVAATGIEFAILRLGTSEGIDKNFEKNYNAARAAGLDVGAYIYTYSTNKSGAIKDAQKCVKWLEGKRLQYPVFFDIEDTAQSKLGKKKNTEMVIAFIEEMFSHGWYAGAYSAASWYDYNLDYVEIGSKYDAWVARFWDGTPSSKGEYARKFGIYQYTQKGDIDGIEGGVDLNVSYKDFPSIIREGGYNGYGSWDSANKGFLFYGDANGDESVKMDDVTAIQKSIAGLQALDAEGEEQSDVNGDGTVSLEDVVLLQKYIAGLIEVFPAEE